jgi:glycosyltransferase involved in cell wall biosynthesis
LIKFIYSFSDGIIVHENQFKQTLITQYHCNQQDKIHIIHHGIEQNVNIIEKSRAKKQLGFSCESIILFFGYLSHYKGLDLLINSLKYLKITSYHLLIAGGPHPRLKERESYNEYLDQLIKNTKKDHPNVHFTGFVSEEEISLYFSAADVIVFPYIIVMSSSGPMALAISYEKPFLVSKSYHDIVDERIQFSKTPEGLASKVNEFFKNPNEPADFSTYVSTLKKQRSWEEIGKQHVNLYGELGVMR